MEEDTDWRRYHFALKIGSYRVALENGEGTMRKWMMTGLVLAGLAVFHPARARADKGDFGGDAREAQRHGWLMSYQEGLEQARKLRKPMMLVFRCVP